MEFIEVHGNDMAIMEEIVDLEKDSLGAKGGVDIWVLKPLVRYGKVFALRDQGMIVSACEYIQKFQSNEVYLYGISTRVGCWGNGYAREILEKSMEYFRKKGMEKISLTVDPDNERAVKLYENTGYSIEGRNKNEYGKGTERIHMIKKFT